jgi:hypothetical protein
LDVDICLAQCVQLPHNVLLAHYVRVLLDDGQRRRDLAAWLERCANIHHDRSVGTHLPRNIQRNIVGHQAVDQEPAIKLHGVERSRHRHAGTNRAGQISRAEHDLVPRLDVGGHGAERDRQVVEATDSGDVLRQADQFQIKLLALYVAQRQLEFAGFISQLLLDQVNVVVALAAKLSLRSRRLILEHVIPVHVPDLAFDLFRAEA